MSYLNTFSHPVKPEIRENKFIHIHFTGRKFHSCLALFAHSGSGPVAAEVAHLL